MPYTTTADTWAARGPSIFSKAIAEVQVSKGRPLTAFGRTQTVRQWAEETGIPNEVIGKRLDQLKWTPERALTQAARKLNKCQL